LRSRSPPGTAPPTVHDAIPIWQQLAPADVVWSYSGVRPLLADESTDPMRVTRDYALELDRHPLPLLSVCGGKITTSRGRGCRSRAEEHTSELQSRFDLVCRLLR